MPPRARVLLAAVGNQCPMAGSVKSATPLDLFPVNAAAEPSSASPTAGLHHACSSSPHAPCRRSSSAVPVSATQEHRRSPCLLLPTFCYSSSLLSLIPFVFLYLGAPTAATIAGDGAPTPNSARLHCFGVIPVAGGCSTWPPLAPTQASHHLRHPCSFPTGVALNLSLPLFFRDEQSSSPAPLDALTACPASARRAKPPPQPARTAPQPQASCFADLGRSPW